MNKKLRITLVILMVFFIFDPLKLLGLRPLTNLEREEEFFKSFQLKDYIERDYNALTVTSDSHTKRETGENASKKAKEIIRYFESVQLKTWKGPFERSEDFSYYSIMMNEDSKDEALMIDILSENRVNIIVRVPFKESRDYHDWNYEVVGGIDMEYIESYFNSLSD